MDQENTVWTDGSRLDSGRVGAAVAFKEAGSWKGRGTYLGQNKEVFDAEVFAIGHALEIISERGQSNRTYTIFSDSQAALLRIQHDRTGPGQTLAVKAIAIAKEITERGNTLILRWTPSHEGVIGNEQADQGAKAAAEGERDTADHDYLKQASLSHLTRITTEARTNATSEWIRNHSGRHRRYRPPRGGKMRKDLNRAPKEQASRFYQLLSGHAATAEHLVRVGQARSEACFWCGSGEKQTRYHLFVKCKRWTPEIKELGRRSG